MLTRLIYQHIKQQFSNEFIYHSYYSTKSTSKIINIIDIDNRKKSKRNIKQSENDSVKKNHLSNSSKEDLKVVHDTFFSLSDVSTLKSDETIQVDNIQSKKITIRDNHNDSKLNKTTTTKNPSINEPAKPKWMSKKWFTSSEDLEIENDVSSSSGNIIEAYDTIVNVDRNKELEQENNVNVIENNEDKELEELEEEEEEAKITTVKKGTDFEILTIETLSKYGLDLKRKGGAGDKGIDFTGIWRLPDQQIKEINIVGQCKNYKRKIGPVVLREFESTLQRFVEKNNNIVNNNCISSKIALNNNNCIGFLSSYTRFSDSLQSDIDSIKNPLILCQITERGILSFILNQTARNLLPSLLIVSRKQPKTFLNNNHNSINTDSLKDSNQTLLELCYRKL